jgi:hypothetical protein
VGLRFGGCGGGMAHRSKAGKGYICYGITSPHTSYTHRSKAGSEARHLSVFALLSFCIRVLFVLLITLGCGGGMAHRSQAGGKSMFYVVKSHHLTSVLLHSTPLSHFSHNLHSAACTPLAAHLHRRLVSAQPERPIFGGIRGGR